MNDWEKRYQQGETGWDRGGASPAIDHWLSALLTAPARVLIPGCGRGHEAVYLVGHGFSVAGIDIAPSAVSHLKQQLAQEGLEGEVILGDLFTYQPEALFDVVYEQTCLCAIQPDERQPYEAKLYEWLKPGGHLLALFMQTGAEGGPPFHCDLLAMRKLFPAVRWQWPADEPLFVPHRNGRFELGYQLIRK
ncbi:MAG: thiopurine S-methyltransferase [Zetaproteobacteria bacterium CG_4_9_14_3_um_filter_49_83]|nr:MAG: thiopurine S-methyltransferase [Zetaproteobacteria bacterium CG1_02_49_23]PIQ30906.1 MAG: thiopurine S-methyltransferase [Zetaproteobacteria bacterium CG17_big_fil_post_rev_8_21_14_2_50_50_13]PIV30833.1 MAG: thiopurine S-methyltransferase [Zetaproteobacteria bacterium CG02_land_8_20_14_3_00_50_9]PIY56225.1 MAG: thiopurine S-methyltransferase [Zetaproteobacteria bacterium CG_4_10_14_0_8_um_filter_49_80]PJA34708.1 MAG: thiopurine S-methyltransferase [Zetaproteobacteria bacterium CG_4_9_14